MSKPRKKLEIKNHLFIQQAENEGGLDQNHTGKEIICGG